MTSHRDYTYHEPLTRLQAVQESRSSYLPDTRSFPSHPSNTSVTTLSQTLRLTETNKASPLISPSIRPTALSAYQNEYAMYPMQRGKRWW